MDNNTGNEPQPIFDKDCKESDKECLLNALKNRVYVGNCTWALKQKDE